MVALLCASLCRAQNPESPAKGQRVQNVVRTNNRVKETQDSIGRTVFLVPVTVYKGDTLPTVKLPTLYVFKPKRFKSKREKKRYDKLVRDVKITLPIANEVRGIVIETYEYLQTIPDEKARRRHINAVEKGLKEQYTPRLKKLSLSQGKLLIKLVDRQTNSTGYELVRAFMGSFKAVFYQTFASLFGASLKKDYDADGEDAEIERIVLMVESGQL